MKASEVTPTMRRILEAASRSELEVIVVRKTTVQDKQRKYRYNEWVQASPYLRAVRSTTISTYYTLNRSGENLLAEVRKLAERSPKRGRSTIDEHTIRAIRSEAEGGEAYVDLAEKYSISPSMVRNIALRVSYKEVE